MFEMLDVNELGAINAMQSVVMELYPGNNIYPSNTGIAGYLVIIPAPGFGVVSYATPSCVPGKNCLPCSSWPETDRINNRWLCEVRDTNDNEIH